MVSVTVEGGVQLAVAPGFNDHSPVMVSVTAKHLLAIELERLVSMTTHQLW